jgi:hypothetical protein
MKRPLFFLLAVTALAALTGCAQDHVSCQSQPQGITGLLSGSCATSPETCQGCGALGRCRLLAGLKLCDQCAAGDPAGRLRCALHGRRDRTPTPGPPVGAVTYPYYTVRGPRDFLARDPRPIGP